MNELFLEVRKITDHVALSYGLSIELFFIIYLVSFLPFYLGYFLMIHGTTRKLRLNDFFSLNAIKGKLHWDVQVTTGLLVHLVGRIMPYAYIVLVGKNLPIWLYIIVYGFIISCVLFFVYKISSKKKHEFPKDIKIIMRDQIIENGEVKVLWSIYNETFEPLNKISPCKQSLDEAHFIEALRDSSVIKHLIYKDTQGIVGLGLITNNFNHLPWISEDYFKSKYENVYNKRNIYYFMGIAMRQKFRGNRYSVAMIEHMIDALPRNIIIGFDHSVNINPGLHHFTRVISQARLIKRTHIDRQHYHVVEYKK